MSEEREQGTVIDLLLHEPDILAWLEDYRPLPETAEDDDGDPPQAA